MQTIKLIIFGAFCLTFIVSAVMVFLCMCAVEVSDLWAYVKMFFGSIALCGASMLAIKYLYKRWYE